MPVVYESLCPAGSGLDLQLKEAARKLGEAIRGLLDDETEFPEHVARDRAKVDGAKAKRDQKDMALMRHVAHCTKGCKRAPGGDLAFAHVNEPGVNSRAPSHQKPELPGLAELAERIRGGETVHDLAAQYDRHWSTLQQNLNNAGYSSRTGEPQRRRGPLSLSSFLRAEDQPWAADALCAQTDPESFYPEKGESTQAAKAVCASCLVQAECLDYALAGDERFGVWGGLSERERRRIKQLTNPLTRNQQESA